MKKQRLIAFSLFVLGGLVFGMAQQAVAGPEIVGAPKCRGCHRAKTGDQWKIWTESAHAKAYEILASVEARNIAADRGLGNPQSEEACLRCHATRSSLGADVLVSDKGSYSDSEGVGCESCHGPGSDYKVSKVMKDPEAAKAAGLLKDKSMEACRTCHNKESPTYRDFDFEARWAQIAHPVPVETEAVEEAQGNKPPLPAADTSPSLASADTLQEVLFESSVGYVIFPHDVHVTDAGLECAECHHQIHAVKLDTPHPNYLKSSWINCQECHNPESDTGQIFYECSKCHHKTLANIADETLSAKVVIHKSCWKCHETGTGVDASKGCVGCHIKESKEQQ